MAIHWQIQFKSFTGASRCVNIYDNTYSGDPVQLTGAANPFKTSEDDDLDYYAPIRTQSGYISIIAENNTILDDLMATKSTDRPVTLTEGNYVLWFGFLHCELYSQPWEAPPYVVQIPIISAVAAYQGVEVPSTEGSITLLDLLNMITVPDVTIEYVVPDGLPIDTLQVPLDAFRDYLSIPERTEMGVTGKYYRQSVYDAIEAFCKYYGVSCRQYQDQIMLVRDNEQHYNNMDRTGETQGAQWGDMSLDSMTICGAKNYRDFAQAYKRVKGTFQTQRDKFDTIMDFPSFMEEFAYNSVHAIDQMMLFNGNAIVTPYLNDVPGPAWSTINADYGGQIIRKHDEYYTDASWTDYFLMSSQKTQAGNPAHGITFNLQKTTFKVDNEYAAINIQGEVLALDPYSQGEGFIKKLFCKLRVGNYWLVSSNSASNYSWSLTEGTCALPVDEKGNIEKTSISYVSYQILNCMNSINGFAIDLPNLAAGAHDVYFELLVNAEDTADFGTFTTILYLVSGLKISLLRGVNDPSQPTPSLDQNEIIRTTGAAWANDYEIEGTITTKRGTQYGAGCALDENLEYITTKYDEQGIARRAAFYAVPREVITVDVRSNTQPIDNVTFGGSTYHILSQQIDWWDDINRIKLIKIS